ncbi:MAG: hypothetical protein R3Y43_05745 [Alphaproteobacteria bacterium]
MNKRIITGGTIGLTFLLNANITLATDSCSVSASCEELGYTDTDSDCDNYLICPFDKTQVFCVRGFDGIKGDNCYQDGKVVGVTTNVNNLCVSNLKLNYENWSFAMGYNSDGDGDCSGNTNCTVETAASYCSSSLGEGWRLPRYEECIFMFTIEEDNNADYIAVNEKLSAAGGTSFGYKTGYWTSSEVSSSSSYAFWPYSGKGYAYSKSASNPSLFCVRVF